MSNDELQKAIDDITRDNAMPVAPVAEATEAENEALANEMAGAPVKGEGVALNPTEAGLGAAPAPNVPETPGMPPVPATSGVEAGAVASNGGVNGNVGGGTDASGAAGAEANAARVSAMGAAGEGDVNEDEVEKALAGIGGAKVGAEISEEPKAEVVEVPKTDGIAPVEAFSEEQAEKMTIGEEEAPTDFESIEKAAMKELYPLIEQVSLSAEEKFEICMEVAAEEPKAVVQAFEAAKRIQGEKEKAEALLRIVKFKK